VPGDLTAQNKQKTLLIVLLLAAVALIVYWPAQDFEFTNYDDHVYVSKNRNVQEGFTVKSIAYAFTDVSTSNWHPLTMLSHMLDWSLFRSKAGSHHWTSVLIHIFNTILLFFFLKSATGALWRSAFVAALFAVHPINVDSVAWIAERKNVLSTFFWMAALVFYVRYCVAPGWKRYFPIVISFALGLMAKPMLVTLPFVLLLLDYWPLNRTRWNPETNAAIPVLKKETLAALIWEKVPLFALSALSVAATLYAAQSYHSIATLNMVPIDKRLANVVVSYALYIKQMFWPLAFSVLYPFNYNIPIWQIISAAVLIAAVTFIVCVYYRKIPYLPVGWFWYLGTLVPVIGIVHVGMQSIADRYAYIPLIGLFLIITWGLSDVLKKLVPPKIPAVAAVGIIATLMFLAQNQLLHWRNSETLYQNAIQVAAKHYLPHKNLALYYIDVKKPKEAVEHMQIAISMKKNDPTLHNSLGVALDMMGKSEEAEKQYKIALKLNPIDAIVHSNMGLLFMKQGKTDEALKHLREAVRLDPKLASAHFYLTRTLKQKGLNGEAASQYKKAGSLNPNFYNLK
jgi:tetratricopeptide (TPR) repeat protein